MQSFRNEKLVKLLFKLGYIENYASGLTRVFNEYKRVNLVPEIRTSLTFFKITLPNINFKAFNHQDKVNGGVNGEVNGEVNCTLNNKEKLNKIHKELLQKRGSFFRFQTK